MNFRYLSTLCLLWTATLSLLGCGGAASSDNTIPNRVTTFEVQPGVYYDANDGHAFWGVITPSSRWYGLHYATTNPDIYSGELTGMGTLKATVPTPALKYQNTANTLLSGSANITSSAAGILSGDLSLITTPSIPPVSFTATNPAGFTYNQAAELSAVAGNWTGQLSFGSGSSANFGIAIASPAGTVTARASDGSEEFAHCKWTSSSSNLTPNSSVNLFAMTLHMAASTGCDTHLDGKTLTGIAFVTPTTGNSHRLIWVATTTDGHAISFKADR